MTDWKLESLAEWQGNFRRSVPNGKKEDYLWRQSTISERIFREITVPFDFQPKFPDFFANTETKNTHLMTSLVSGIGNRQLHFLVNFKGIEKLFYAPDQSLNSKIINQCNIDFFSIKKDAKISFHRHFKNKDFLVAGGVHPNSDSG